MIYYTFLLNVHSAAVVPLLQQHHNCIHLQIQVVWWDTWECEWAQELCVVVLPLFFVVAFQVSQLKYALFPTGNLCRTLSFTSRQLILTLGRGNNLLTSVMYCAQIQSSLGQLWNGGAWIVVTPISIEGRYRWLLLIFGNPDYLTCLFMSSSEGGWGTNIASLPSDTLLNSWSTSSWVWPTGRKY